MQNLTPQGQQFVNDVAARYNLSMDAVLHMLNAVNNGAGSMAQFNCPELGGSGQWMRGGMTMVGDMFNHGLKMTVDNLCVELANGLASMQVYAPLPAGHRNSNQWWPQDLGQPHSSGAQNNIRYAVFPNRLAVQLNGQVTVYDTLDNNISGVSQQQGGDSTLTFSSQYGTIAVNTLPIVSGLGIPPAPVVNFAEPAPHNQGTFTNTAPKSVESSTTNINTNVNANEAIELIEKLAKLRDAGAISDDEFNSKKTELINRI